AVFVALQDSRFAAHCLKGLDSGIFLFVLPKKLKGSGSRLFQIDRYFGKDPLFRISIEFHKIERKFLLRNHKYTGFFLIIWYN
ncbi:hypothetical protein, partial [Anaerotignum sp.]